MNIDDTLDFELQAHIMMSASIFFTRANEDNDPRQWTGRKEQNRDKTLGLSGLEARNFYQSLLEGSDGQKVACADNQNRGVNRRQKQSRESDRCKRRCKEGKFGADSRRNGSRRGGNNGGGGTQTDTLTQSSQGSSSSERDGHLLLRLAQEGNLSALRRLLKAGRVDLNFHDGFYWTAVMCASHAGRGDAVKLLLEHGASWVGVVDTQGQDARDLAERAGHEDIVGILDQHGRGGERGLREQEASQGGMSYQERLQWCPTCECEYSEPEGRHQSSTLHQFNRGRLGLDQPSAPHYCLPPSSAGYRMMLRSGWDPGAGLGPEGQGSRQPIRTVLKRDQAGLGYGSPLPPKVTHFKAKDLQAVKRPTKPTQRREKGTTITAQAQRKEERRQKDFERDFRSSFHIDC